MPFITPSRKISSQSQIGANTIGTEQLIDADIAAADLAPNSVDSSELVDNAVTLAKQAHGTQGGVFFYGATGTPTELATGTAGQLLQSGGAAANPTWVTFTQDWEQLGETILGTAAASISVSSFAARKDLRIIFQTGAVTGANATNLTFNSDTGTTYGTNTQLDAAAPVLLNDQTSIALKAAGSTVSRFIYCEIDVCNAAAGQRKYGFWKYMKLANLLKDAPAFQVHGAFEWGNEAAQITTVTITGASGDLGIDTRLTVYGKSD